MDEPLLFFCTDEEPHEAHDVPFGMCCGSVNPHSPHGDCLGLMADDGSNDNGQFYVGGTFSA